MKKVLIIAEAGVNHNGNIEFAYRLIDVAVAAGADAIKFQTYRTEKLVTKKAPKADYQKATTNINETQFDMIKKLELDEEAHYRLLDYCNKKKIMFLSSAFDVQSARFLNKLGLEIFKIPSGEITNIPFLREIGGFNKKVIISTGMADISEIEDALGVLISSGTKKENIFVLHCNTEYPTPFEDVNLKAMLTISDVFHVKVGYSDHTLGIEVPVAAVAIGAKVIEKHITLDKNMEGPDHKTSLEPEELKAMVKAIRNIEKALGDGIKRPSKSELKNKTIVRKSIVAARNIKKGEVFSEDNLAIKRPGTGIPPIRWDKVIGVNAKKNFKKDELIEI